MRLHHTNIILFYNCEINLNNSQTYGGLFVHNAKKKTDTLKYPLVFSINWLNSSCNLAWTKAACACINSFRRAVNNRLNSFNVGFPSSVRSSVRVRNLNTKGYVLATKFAFCHFKGTSLLLQSINLITTNDIVTENDIICKYFLKIIWKKLNIKNRLFGTFLKGGAEQTELWINYYSEKHPLQSHAPMTDVKGDGC